MPSVIVSDTSCFIVLSNIHQLDLLQNLYGEVITTPEVYKEFGETLPDWVRIIPAENLSEQKTLSHILDLGEASAISLALEIPGCTIILDDIKARTYAAKIGLKVTGTLGVLIKAKHAGIIKSIKPIISAIRATDFYISDELEAQVLKLTNE